MAGPVGAQGLLELGDRRRRAKDPERLSTSLSLEGQPYPPLSPHRGHVSRLALPVSAGAPTLQSVRREPHASIPGHQAAAGEAPSVAAGGSDGDHTKVIGHCRVAL
jgi:hypothetical protein